MKLKSLNNTKKDRLDILKGLNDIIDGYYRLQNYSESLSETGDILNMTSYVDDELKMFNKKWDKLQPKIHDLIYNLEKIRALIAGEMIGGKIND